MRVKDTLAFRLTTSFAISFLVVHLVAMLFTAFTFNANLNNYLKQSPMSIAEAVASELEDDLVGDAQLKGLSKELESLSLRYGAQIIIYDQNGTPILISGSDRSACETPWCMGPMGQMGVRTVTVPLIYENRIYGFVGVVVNRETSVKGAIARFQQGMFTSLALIAASTVITSLLLFFLVSRQVAKPIVRAAEVARRISEGNYSAKIEEKNGGELGMLNESLNLLSDRLEKIEQRRMELASDIVHEFKTPLSVLKANLEGIRDGVVVPEKSRLNKLIDEIDHLSKLLEELKTIQKLDSSEERPDLRSVELSDFVRELVDVYRTLAENKNIDVVADLKPALAHADLSYLQRIFENLFLNSVMYTGPGGKIFVRTYAIGNHACLEVEDTGIGISKDDLPFIFDRFYRAESSRSRKTGGSGLGLAIVKKLVEKMSGRVEVSSQEGKGTKFTVYLPLARKT